jgi:hypothetical protein
MAELRKGEEPMEETKVTRRDFLKVSGAGATAATVVMTRSGEADAAAGDLDPTGVVGAMGDTLIPSDPGDPGYKTLEAHNITAEVLKELGVKDDELLQFNVAAQELFPGRTFLQLKEEERNKYFDAVFAGEKFEKEMAGKLQRTLRRVRQRVFQVYYGNYPEHAMARDAKGVPILAKGDTHQITNPNSKGLVTGWDVAGFMGPLSWEEEERRRNLVKKIDWKE